MSERDCIQSFSEYLFWDVDKTSIDLEAMLRMWLEGCLNLDNSATGISWSGDMVFRESLRLLKIFVPLIHYFSLWNFVYKLDAGYLNSLDRGFNLYTIRLLWIQVNSTDIGCGAFAINTSGGG